MNRWLMAAALAVAMPAAASAVTITAKQGDTSAGVDVPLARSNLDAATDGNNGTFFSLGIGGFFSIDVTPLRLGSPASVIEVTFGSPNNGFPESADLFLGGSVTGTGLSDLNSFDATGALNIGSLDNSANAPVGLSGAIISKSLLGNDFVSYTIDFSAVVGVFTRLTLVDTTDAAFYAGRTGSNASDGFDIGEISVNAVPLPAPLLLLLSGIAGLGVMSFRRRAAA